ncbi:MAG: TonB-dependent receptor [Steroidobacteraceae bacterium]
MRKLLACSTGFLISMGGFAPAMAQTDTASLQLEEVIVTAEKRETNLQKTSISIQVTSGDQLRQEGKRRIDEILSQTSGVEFQTNAFGANVFLRGLGNVEGIPGGGEKAVATIIDGAYQYRTETLSSGTLDVAQVEVMRGAQGTTLGAGSLAGAVSLVSNKPVFEYQASGSLEGGNYNLINAEGVLNLPLASNQAVRMAYSIGKRDGYVSSGAGNTDNVNGRVRYRWLVNDDLDIVATYNFQRSNNIGRNDTVATTGYYRGAVAGDSCLPPFSTALGAIDRCPYGQSVTTGTAPNAVTSYYGGSIVHINDGVGFRDRANAWNDGFPKFGWPDYVYRNSKINTFGADINWNLGFGTLTITPQLQNARNVSNEAPMGAAITHEDTTEKSKQVEARLASSNNSKLQWLGGVYYYYRNTPTTGSYDLNYVTGLYSFPGMGVDLKNDAGTRSVFGNATFSILDQLRVIGGVRYSKDTKSSLSQANATATPTTLNHTWQDTTYRVGLEYDVLTDSMLYATYQTGYQPGSLTAMGVCEGTAGFSCAQTTEQITLGIKNQFFDKKLQLNVEAFDTTYHNRPFQGSFTATQTVNGQDGTGTVAQSYCTATGPAAANAPDFYRDLSLSCVRYNTSITVPDWTSKGVDVDLSWIPTNNDRFDLTAEYLVAKQGTLPVSFSANAIFASSGLAAGMGETVAGTLADAQVLANILNAQVAQYDGLTPQNSPKYVLNGTYQHKFAMASGASLTPKINGIYKTKYWSQGGAGGANIVAPGAAYQPNYYLWNAYLTYQSSDGKWSATANVKNAFEEVVQINYGTQDVQLNAPRTFGLSINASF